MKKILYILPAIFLLAAGCSSTTSTTVTPPPSNESTYDTNTNAAPPASTGGNTTSANPNITLAVSGKNFSFSPTTLRAKKGDVVKINFTNSQGTHDFVIDELNVKTPIVQDGQTASVTFTADKTGSFEFYCSVGNHREMGMKGTFLVE